MVMGSVGDRRRFGGAQGGNVAMMWALLAAFMVGLTGITVDFTRAQMLRAQIQNAADGAALAAARGDAQTAAQREAAALAFFNAEMGSLAASCTIEITDLEDGEVRVRASVPMPLSLGKLVRNEDWIINVESDAKRSGVNVEVALVLDVTGSMAGTRITDLRAAATDLVDAVVRVEQIPYYSKVALVTYSTGVNLGGYANQARGSITPGRSLSNPAMNWLESTSRNISGIAKGGSGQLTVTSNSHGFVAGERVFITGVNGMTQVNNTVFTVSNVATNTFRLQTFAGANVNGSSYNNYTSGGIIRRCRNNDCEVVFNASGHGFSADEWIYITGVGGMAVSGGGQAINTANVTTTNNPNLWRVGQVLDSNTFSLKGSFAPNYGNYTSGGTAYCLARGCEFYRFNNANSRIRVLPITTCVSERWGADRYNDVSPAGSPVGRNYARSANANTMCPSGVVEPLSTDADTLNLRIAGMSASGYTAGHIGLAWGWYMVSPNFGHLWPTQSRPADYGTPETLKIVVLMTDGAFNTGYCDEVVSRDSGMGGDERSDCRMTDGPGRDANDTAYAQAQALCTAMKARGVVVYTVGFQLGGDTATQNLMRNCATTTDHAYLSSNGTQLRAAFAAIAASITQLRLTR